MAHDGATSERAFESIVEALQDRAGVTKGRMFGSTVLKVQGKVFAMLVKGKLVVKLSRQRAEDLVAAGAGEYFDPGHGRPSKEWIAMGEAKRHEWQTLAEEALKNAGAAL